MGKRLPYTPNSQIKSALRNLFLRSRERNACLKRDQYTCQACGAKQSRAEGKEVYVEVHHTGGILNWDELYKAVRKYLLCHPDNLATLCKTCHKKERKKVKVKKTFAIEYHLNPDLYVETHGWEVWKRYRTKRDRDQALKQLRHSHGDIMQFRSKK